MVFLFVFVSVFVSVSVSVFLFYFIFVFCFVLFCFVFRLMIHLVEHNRYSSVVPMKPEIRPCSSSGNVASTRKVSKEESLFWEENFTYSDA